MKELLKTRKFWIVTTIYVLWLVAACLRYFTYETDVPYAKLGMLALINFTHMALLFALLVVVITWVLERIVSYPIAIVLYLILGLMPVVLVEVFFPYEDFEMLFIPLILFDWLGFG